MTGLQRWRKIAKSLIVTSLTWEAAATIAGLVFLTFVLVQGSEAVSFEQLISIVGTIGLFGVVIGAIWEARRRKRRHHPERGENIVEENSSVSVASPGR